jgi:sigma-B regulation protein RsbU (phosphoserine phosphatase)
MTTSGSAAAAAAAPRILVVDDNDDNRYTLELYLDLEGYSRVETASDGEEAIARLACDRFDLVLLDVMMPKVDGYQVLAWIKQQPSLRDLPVIMISALTEMNSVVRCIELGALDYLLKPFNSILLKARLSATLEKKRLQNQIDAHLARLEAELAAARRLQMTMAPRSFPVPSLDFPFEISASLEPAREVGGDLYDFFVLPDGVVCFLVGDVCGKGMPAALYMAQAKGLVRITTELMWANGASVEPSDIIARVNRELCRNNSDVMFVTMFFAMLAPRTGEVRFCNAGHNPPYRMSRDALQTIDGAKGFLLGVHPDAAFATGQLTLAPGEVLYLFTDGVTEATDSTREMFSEARLEAALRGSKGRTGAELLAAVTAAIRDFVGGASPSDDVAMLAVRRVEPE